MMSKRIDRFLALLFVLALALAGLLPRQSSGAAVPQQGNVAKSVAKSNARNAAIVAATTEVLKETSEIRELAILRPVKSGAQSRSEIERMLIKNLNSVTDRIYPSVTNRCKGLCTEKIDFLQLLPARLGNYTLKLMGTEQ